MFVEWVGKGINERMYKYKLLKIGDVNLRVHYVNLFTLYLKFSIIKSFKIILIELQFL